MLERKLLVVGCGHSATFYISEVFQKLGIDVRHELVGRDGAAGWNYTHLLQQGRTEAGMPASTIVFHQVRHPLKVISSVQDMGNNTWEAIGARAQLNGVNWNPLEDNHPVRGMKYWLIWNGFAERIAQYRYRIEDLQGAWSTILRMAGIDYVPIPDVPKTINKHQYDHVFTWDELFDSNASLADCVRKLSEKYGYDTE